MYLIFKTFYPSHYFSSECYAPFDRLQKEYKNESFEKETNTYSHSQLI